MKIRSDYVSNSSSSSFVVVLPKDYNQDDFIDDVVRACSDDKDGDYDEEFVEKLNKFNRRNLDFCMNSYELLFIGELEVGWIPDTITGEEDVSEFIKSVDNMKRDNYQYTPRILSQTKDKVEFEDMDVAANVTINAQSMRYHVRYYKYRETDEDYRKKVVENIMKCCGRSVRYNLFTRDDRMGICEITMNTILNTQDLIAEGKKLELPKWADLDALKKRIEDGDRIICIEMNQGGDGQDIGSIYALNGWDSDFNKYADVQVLGSWLG